MNPGHLPRLRLFALERELSQMLGRKVDLNTANFLSPYFRGRALAEAQLQYDSDGGGGPVCDHNCVAHPPRNTTSANSGLSRVATWFQQIGRSCQSAPLINRSDSSRCAR
jgi:hypothetical protein